MDTIKVAIISAFVVCVAIIAALGILYWQYAGQVANLEKQNQDLQQSNSSLQEENDRLNSDAGSLKTANQNLVQQANDLRKQVSDLQQQNAQLQQQVNSLQKTQTEKCPTTPTNTSTPAAPGMGIIGEKQGVA
jgi:peptidoglycan hydrolase CwlO-like protein